MGIAEAEGAPGRRVKPSALYWWGAAVLFGFWGIGW